MNETVVFIIEMFIAVLTSALASSGLWAYLTSKNEKKSAMGKMVMGLGHDRILYLGEVYIKRGYITVDEYDNLVNYLYEPYKKLGGNGTAAKIIDAVNKLPIK